MLQETDTPNAKMRESTTIAVGDVETQIIPKLRDLGSIRDMMGGTPLRHLDMRETEPYRRLAAQPIHGFSFRGRNERGNPTFAIVGPSLNAPDLNAVMFFVAPYKDFGPDTDGVIKHMIDLYEDPELASVRSAHELMPGWGSYAASHDRILGLLQRSFDLVSGRFHENSPEDVIVPLLRWRENENHDMEIVLDPPSGEEKEVLGELFPDLDLGKTDSGVGAAFLAAYSPDNTNWRRHNGFRPNAPLRFATGPAQAVAFVLREIARAQMDPVSVLDNQDIQQSPLLSKWKELIEAGDMAA